MFRSRVPAVDLDGIPSGGYLLDVREDDEWACGHAPHAVHLPLSELMARVEEVPADQDVYVICKAGGRSEQAAGYLNQVGRTAVNVTGGMLAWAAAGRPMQADGGADPFVA